MLDPTDFGYGYFHFHWGDHICAIFDDYLQQREVMLPFIANGLRAAQRCAWIGPEASCNMLRQSLTEFGGDLPTLEASGQLVIISDVDYYLQDDLFDPSRTLELMHALLADGRRQGYDTMRLTADVSWLKTGRSDAELWEDYEVRMNDALADLPVVVVCQYAHRQVSGSLVVTALRTHPLVILGENLHENPFYAPMQSASDIM